MMMSGGGGAAGSFARLRLAPDLWLARGQRAALSFFATSL
jgi:hypothetical protein